MPEITMRAKFRVQGVEPVLRGDENVCAEKLTFSAVSKDDGYPADGLDEDNSFARWTPNASLEMTVQNPELFGKFVVGQKFYADFTPAN